MVRLALHSCMRAGEIQSIRRDQADLARRVVRLGDTKNGSARTVPLTHSALAAVREAVASYAAVPELPKAYPT